MEERVKHEPLFDPLAAHYDAWFATVAFFLVAAAFLLLPSN